MKTENNLFWDGIKTPLGNMILVWDQESLITVGFKETSNLLYYKNAQKKECPEQFSKAFEDYFKGDIHALENLPIKQKGSSFYCRVWKELRKIPFGETRSYSEIAKAVGNPKAVRAVGTANAKNPHTLIVPCHRVI
ncbi:MAG: methylated-DNA--[protein]-cysteine S-methyltransferase, partial [Proteobacteria bacterium]|nr:methylated-DNA--[protein]-cysteine S-methyltransferase [Pseudomonadota bacterium]